MSLARARCVHHPSREAAVRCPGCRRSYCRECVTEHEGRMLCRACLATEGAAAEVASTSRWRPLARGLATLGSLLLAWLIYFVLAEGVRRLPDEFHATSSHEARP